MHLPTVIKKMIKSFLGVDFQREYMLAIIRMLGRENAESPELQLYSEPQEFGEILADLKKFGVDVNTIHGSAFVSKQCCNVIIDWRGGVKDITAKNIFESIMKIPHKVIVIKHQGRAMARIMHFMAAHGLEWELTDLGENFAWVLQGKIERLTDIYGLLS